MIAATWVDGSALELEARRLLFVEASQRSWTVRPNRRIAMGRLPSHIRILALLAALALAQGCKEKERLEQEAPALARADLTIDRIAIAGVISDVDALRDST